VHGTSGLFLIIPIARSLTLVRVQFFFFALFRGNKANDTDRAPGDRKKGVKDVPVKTIAKERVLAKAVLSCSPRWLTVSSGKSPVQHQGYLVALRPQGNWRLWDIVLNKCSCGLCTFVDVWSCNICSASSRCALLY
jgi:hypothetical protein